MRESLEPFSHLRRRPIVLLMNWIDDPCDLVLAKGFERPVTSERRLDYLPSLEANCKVFPGKSLALGITYFNLRTTITLQ